MQVHWTQCGRTSTFDEACPGKTSLIKLKYPLINGRRNVKGTGRPSILRNGEVQWEKAGGLYKTQQHHPYS